MNKLKEAVDNLEAYYSQYSLKCDTVGTSLRTLLNLAQLFLEVKGFPEKKQRNKLVVTGGGGGEVGCPYCERALEHCKCYQVFNEALDLCTLAHVKLMQEKMLTVEEIVKIAWTAHKKTFKDGLEFHELYDYQKQAYQELAQSIHQAAQQKASLKEGK